MQAKTYSQFLGRFEFLAAVKKNVDRINPTSGLCVQNVLATLRDQVLPSLLSIDCTERPKPDCGGWEIFRLKIDPVIDPFTGEFELNKDTALWCDLKWSDVELSPDPIWAPLKAAMWKWAKQNNLTADWILDTAYQTLLSWTPLISWTNSSEYLERLDWAESYYSCAMPDATRPKFEPGAFRALQSPAAVERQLRERLNEYSYKMEEVYSRRGF